MKRNEEFILSEVCDNKLLIPVGEMTKKLNGMVKLNGTGAFIWGLLAEETTTEKILAAVAEKYNISVEGAGEGIEKFLASLRNAGCLEE